jgi:hypothetical protein
MSNFRCSAGHMATLAFGPEEVRRPCPACGVDVYKFRDAVLDEELAPTSVDAPSPGPEQGKPLWRYPRHLRDPRVLACGLLVAGVAMLLIWRHVLAPPPAITPGPVIPVAAAGTPLPAAAPEAARGDPDDVSITDFHAIETDSSTVKLTFRLTNRGNTPNDYPALLVHWHGIANAHQVFRKDSYAHPPLPFKTADVDLVLARPAGATGIDVKIAY